MLLKKPCCCSNEVNLNTALASTSLMTCWLNLTSGSLSSWKDHNKEVLYVLPGGHPTLLMLDLLMMMVSLTP